ncbi:MAG: hypothetical protein JSU07_06070 [Bacteroidetes bacterium]|nr:hypothetical protein [Bacteroidota bacterium]
MSLALYISVKETLQGLRSVLKKASPMMQPRIKMLIVMKKAGEKAVSKRELMNSVGLAVKAFTTGEQPIKKKV